VELTLPFLAGLFDLTSLPVISCELSLDCLSAVFAMSTLDIGRLLALQNKHGTFF
jgi:hypothetical protein